MFGAIHQHFKQYLIQNFSTHSPREGTITMIVLSAQDFIFSLSFLQVIWYLSSVQLYHISHKAKNTEKLTFLILKDDSILWTALYESPITSLKFEHLSNQSAKMILWLVWDTYPKSDVIWKKENTKKCGDNLVPMNCPQTKTNRQGATFWDSHNPFLI